MKSDASTPMLAELLEAITQLQARVLIKLIMMLRNRVDLSAISPFASAVLGELIMESGITAEAIAFRGAHPDLVVETAREVACHEEFTKALSYLYAAKTLSLVFVTKDPFSEEAAKLGERATELGIDIPNTFDICGNENAGECIHAIFEFSKSYAQQRSS